jgi:hypothetical protein
VKVIEGIIENLHTLPHIRERVNTEGDARPYTEAEIMRIAAKIAKGKVVEIKYESGELREALRNKLIDVENDKNEAGKAIERVKSNIKEGECPICMIGLEESDAIINKCCGLVMCATCGIKGARMSTGYAGADGVAIKGNCPQCRAPIQLNELIFINQNFDLNEMIDAQGDEVGEVGESADANDATAGDDGNGKAEDTTPMVELLINKNPKLHALCEIIKGNNVEHTVIDPQLKSLIQGCRDVPVPAGTLRKVIVFAAFTETLQLIQECMEQQKIPFTRLMGTYKQIHQTVMDFRTNDTQVLLINSSTNCAGLDLQFSTDLVFFHKILDTNIQSQVAGRMQRVGREFNGNVHWLLYRNESTYI